MRIFCTVPEREKKSFCRAYYWYFSVWGCGGWGGIYHKACAITELSLIQGFPAAVIILSGKMSIFSTFEITFFWILMKIILKNAYKRNIDLDLRDIDLDLEILNGWLLSEFLMTFWIAGLVGPRVQFWSRSQHFLITWPIQLISWIELISWSAELISWSVIDQ